MKAHLATTTCTVLTLHCPQRNLWLGVPPKNAAAHDARNWAQSRRWPRFRGVKRCWAAAPTLPLSSTPSPWQISFSEPQFPTYTRGTTSMALQICHQSLLPGLGDADLRKYTRGMDPMGRTGLCLVWDQPWTVSLCAGLPTLDASSRTHP